MRPEGPKKIFFETSSPLLSENLDDRAFPLPEGLDQPLGVLYVRKGTEENIPDTHWEGETAAF